MRSPRSSRRGGGATVLPVLAVIAVVAVVLALVVVLRPKQSTPTVSGAKVAPASSSPGGGSRGGTSGTGTSGTGIPGPGGGAILGGTSGTRGAQSGGPSGTSGTRATGPTTGPSSPTYVPPKHTKSTQTVSIFTDGWSAKILGQVGATYTPSAGVTTATAPASAPLVFAPASVSQIGLVAKKSPALLTEIVSRMVTSDANVSCSSSRCHSGAGRISFAELAKARSIPGYGASYVGWGVPSAVDVATITVPDSDVLLTISAPGWSSYGVSLVKQTAPGEPATPQDGYKVDNFLVAAGYGQIFAPAADWTVKGAGPFVESRSSGLAAAPSVAGWSTNPPFTEGLAVPTAAAEGLSDSALTYFTSPTTGCGDGMLCVPTAAHPRIEKASVTTFAACNSAGTKGSATLLDMRWQPDYTALTAQSGIWNGEPASRFAGAGKGTSGYGIGWTGEAPLVKGPVTIRSVEFVITEGTPAKTVDIPAIDYQIGTDPGSSTVYTPSSISRFTSNQWRACKG